MTRKFLATRLIAWQKAHGRQHLPWQNTHDAYKVWLSEVMLQQTQVATVLTYYKRFLDQFPTVAELAAAQESEVMQLWAGLGYYSRARNLHACAKQVMQRFHGVFPKEVPELESLPGIGRSTAGAIASLAYGQSVSILDGNVKRVFCRYFAVHGHPEQSAVKKQLWRLADEEMPSEEPGRYNQALMDLGATVCLPKNPSCAICPLNGACLALKQGLVTSLPTPKSKKPRPNVFCVCLVLRDAQGRVVLQQQTEKGIWQNLWMFPCHVLENEQDLMHFDLKQCVQNWAKGLSGSGWVDSAVCEFGGVGWREKPWLIHELTHRKLHFKWVEIEVPHETPGLVDVTTRPVPRLVHKLLDEIS